MSSNRLIDRVRGAQQRYRAGPSADNAEFERIQKQLHQEIIESLDFEQVGRPPPRERHGEIAAVRKDSG